MTIPTSNVKMSQIRDEFSGGNPVSLSNYYKGGPRVPSNVNDPYSIPTSGYITMGDFRGATYSAGTFHEARITTTAAGGVNVYNALINDGWDGIGEAQLTVDSGVACYSNDPLAVGMYISGDFPNGLLVYNGGYIAGFGGRGGGYWGSTVYAPDDGLMALWINNATCSISGSIDIENHGVICGGGGGGGYSQPANGHFGGGGGGAGGGAGGGYLASPPHGGGSGNRTPFGQGGNGSGTSPGSGGTAGGGGASWGGGGGGGAAYVASIGGLGYNSGTTSQAQGGDGGSYGYVGETAGYNNLVTEGAGGGGGWGAAGGSGRSSQGGNGGAAINSNSLYNLTYTGTIHGALI